MNGIPVAPADLTVPWLMMALQNSGILGDAELANVSYEGVGDVQGSVAQLTRVYLEYTRNDENGPNSLVAKMTTIFDGIRPLISQFGLYEREVRFYRELAQLIDTNVPHCYYSDIDQSGEWFILLLEDMAPAKIGDQIAGCTVEQAQLALESLAQLHATFWNRPSLEDLDWIPNISSAEQMNQKDFRQNKWPRFVERVSHLLHNNLIAVGREYEDKIPILRQHFAKRPRTIFHGDYRLDNLFFGNGLDKADLTVVDWQIMKLGPGACDVAYFLNGNLPIDLRRSSETELLLFYHRRLADFGVTDYSFEEFFEDYKVAIVYSLRVLVEAWSSADLSSDRANELAKTQIRRITAFFRDHNTLDELRSLPSRIA